MEAMEQDVEDGGPALPGATLAEGFPSPQEEEPAELVPSGMEELQPDALGIEDARRVGAKLQEHESFELLLVSLQQVHNDEVSALQVQNLQLRHQVERLLLTCRSRVAPLAAPDAAALPPAPRLPLEDSGRGVQQKTHALGATPKAAGAASKMPGTAPKASASVKSPPAAAPPPPPAAQGEAEAQPPLKRRRLRKKSTRAMLFVAPGPVVEGAGVGARSKCRARVLLDPPEPPAKRLREAEEPLGLAAGTPKSGLLAKSKSQAVLPSWVQEAPPELLLPPPELLLPPLEPSVHLIGGRTFDELIEVLQEAHDADVALVAQEAVDDGAEPFDAAAAAESMVPPPMALSMQNPLGFRSTVDSWNRARDKERIDATLGCPEHGSVGILFVDPTQPGTVVCWGYTRLLFGDHGPYVETMPQNVCWPSFPAVKRKSRWAYYDEHYTRSGSIKVYEQKKTVGDKPNPPPGEWSARNNRVATGYADYQFGRIYISADTLKAVDEHMWRRCTLAGQPLLDRLGAVIWAEREEEEPLQLPQVENTVENSVLLAPSAKAAPGVTLAAKPKYRPQPPPVNGNAPQVNEEESSANNGHAAAGCAQPKDLPESPAAGTAYCLSSSGEITLKLATGLLSKANKDLLRDLGNDMGLLEKETDTKVLIEVEQDRVRLLGDDVKCKAAQGDLEDVMSFYFGDLKAIEVAEMPGPASTEGQKPLDNAETGTVERNGAAPADASATDGTMPVEGLVDPRERAARAAEARLCAGATRRPPRALLPPWKPAVDPPAPLPPLMLQLPQTRQPRRWQPRSRREPQLQ